MHASPRPTPSTHPWHLHPDGTKARLDVPRRERAVADDRLPPRAIPVGSIRGEQPRAVHLKCLRQESWRSLASHRCSGGRRRQRWMGTGHDSILVQGVSTPAVSEG
jgi:hypothetical protein